VGRATVVPLIGVKAGVETTTGGAAPINILTQNVLSIPMARVSPLEFFNSKKPV
jgi:hypothetical protein